MPLRGCGPIGDRTHNLTIMTESITLAVVYAVTVGGTMTLIVNRLFDRLTD